MVKSNQMDSLSISLLHPLPNLGWNNVQNLHQEAKEMQRSQMLT